MLFATKGVCSECSMATRIMFASLNFVFIFWIMVLLNMEEQCHIDVRFISHLVFLNWRFFASVADASYLGLSTLWDVRFCIFAFGKVIFSLILGTKNLEF